MTKRQLAVAALMAAAAIAPPAGTSLAAPGSSAAEDTWQLRAQVRGSPGKTLSEPRLIGDAVALVRDAACRRARDLLGDGEPARAEIELTMWRQPGPTDQTRTGIPDASCEGRFGQESAFRLRARVVHPRHPGRYTETGRMGLRRAVAVLARRANAYAGRVLESGERVWLSLKVRGSEKDVRGMIRGLARRYRVDVGIALRVAGCESGFNPRAFSPAGPYGGVYQHDLDLWKRRAAHYGHRGASVFDPYSNIDVSLRMVRTAGWGHWGCA
jgi:soluble lytic murein transglycosylase-like protein